MGSGFLVLRGCRNLDMIICQGTHLNRDMIPVNIDLNLNKIHALICFASLLFNHIGVINQSTLGIIRSACAEPDAVRRSLTCIGICGMLHPGRCCRYIAVLIGYNRMALSGRPGSDREGNTCHSLQVSIRYLHKFQISSENLFRSGACVDHGNGLNRSILRKFVNKAFLICEITGRCLGLLNGDGSDRQAVSALCVRIEGISVYQMLFIKATLSFLIGFQYPCSDSLLAGNCRVCIRYCFIVLHREFRIGECCRALCLCLPGLLIGFLHQNIGQIILRSLGNVGPCCRTVCHGHIMPFRIQRVSRRGLQLTNSVIPDTDGL